MSDPAIPLHVFRFVVSVVDHPVGGDAPGSEQEIARGAFSEVSGLEGSMEPFEIKEGGRNWGANQRVGRTTFATVVLKRGMTSTRHLWTWFKDVANGAYGHRFDVIITLHDLREKPVMRWRLERALPVKYKAADLIASSNDVGIEELHLVHEGLTDEPVAAGGA